ncbi:MAG: preprotein translocase subunit YajC [Pirellulaceae bacterium]|jgi:preprotein translocase subunit YajC
MAMLSRLFILAQDNAGGQGQMWFMMVVCASIALLYYFMVVRPEKGGHSRQGEMQNSLKKNDHVVTMGGICGVVVNAPKDSKEVTLRVDDSNGTKLRVMRTSIYRVVDKDDKAAEEA